MARPADNGLRPGNPLRATVQRLGYGAALLAAGALLLFGKADTIMVDELRVFIIDAATPFVAATARPLEEAEHFLAQLRELAMLREENGRLREENGRLLEWQTLARRLEEENRQLRRLLRFDPAPGATFVSARAIATTGGPFVRSLLIDVGARDGVERSQAVITGEGLVGRVARVGNRSARVLLITDATSRIPVTVGEGRRRAILSGDNSGQPRLIYMDQGATVRVGDEVVTSGVGGMFPPGLPVGRVAAAEAGGTPFVQPYVDWDRVEFVRVVDYGAAGAGDQLLAE